MWVVGSDSIQRIWFCDCLIAFQDGLFLSNPGYPGIWGARHCCPAYFGFGDRISLSQPSLELAQSLRVTLNFRSSKLHLQSAQITNPVFVFMWFWVSNLGRCECWVCTNYQLSSNPSQDSRNPIALPQLWALPVGDQRQDWERQELPMPVPYPEKEFKL